MYPRNIHVTINDGQNKTETSLFEDLVSSQCPKVNGPLCGEPLYTLELADGSTPPFDYELV